MRRIGWAVIGLAGAFGACSDGGGNGLGAEAEPYVVAAQEAIGRSFPDGIGVTDEKLRCMAEHQVAGIEVATFEAAGIEPEDVADEDVSGLEDLDLELTEAQARAAAGSDVACGVDFGALLAEFEGQPEAADCLNERIDRDKLLEGEVQSLLGNDSEASDLFDEAIDAAGEECLE